MTGDKNKKDDGLVIVFEKCGTVEIKNKYEKKGDIPPKIESPKKEEPPKETAKAGS